MENNKALQSLIEVFGDRIRELAGQGQGQGKSNEPRCFFSPGRVNLMGEYTDFNGGNVLPFAIDLGTCLLAVENAEGRFSFQSTNYSEAIELSLNTLQDISSKQAGFFWANYPIGVLKEFFISCPENWQANKGVDFFFSGNLPIASGLSSSASIEMATAFALNEMFSFAYSSLALAKTCQASENNFIGVNCGIMDPLSIASGKADCLLRIDCSNDVLKPVSFKSEAHALMVIDSKKPRQLSKSKYNERVSECAEALNTIKKAFNEFQDVKHLCHLPLERLNDFNSVLPDILQKRVGHLLKESQRVDQVIAAIEINDWKGLGALLNDSHYSLSGDFEVSGETLDTLTEIIRSCDGVLGSRMTGAGFGGCTISLVESAKFDEIRTKVIGDYRAATGFEAEAYLMKPCAGAREISVPGELLV